MNWYVLFVVGDKQEQILQTLVKWEVDAFSPVMEYYRRDIRSLTFKRMFPGYIFVRTERSWESFLDFLRDLRTFQSGVVKELERSGLQTEPFALIDEDAVEHSAALRPEEIRFFKDVLDERAYVRMSCGYPGKDGKAVITDGPLMKYADRICKVDRHNQLAWLDLSFFDRQIMMGLDLRDEYRTQTIEE